MLTSDSAEYTADQRKYFDAIATDEWHTHDWNGRAVRERYDAEQIFRMVGKAETILHVGCGSGSQDPILASYDFVRRIDSVDPSPKMIEQANTHFPNPKVKRWVAGYEDLPASRSYDLTLSVDVFEHVDKPEAFLNTMRGVVKPNGHVCIITPNRNRWQNIERIATFRRPKLLSALHFREYSVPELCLMGIQCGLTPVGWFGEDFYSSVLPINQTWSLRIGHRLKRLAHCVGVVFRATTTS